jgi:phage baseplate assembly protein W
MSENLGTDLLLENGDLAISPTGDLALTPTGRVCLLQDIASLLETLPGDLYGYPEYGAGVGRLFGEENRNIESRIKRTIEDALNYSGAIAGRIIKGSAEVTSTRITDSEIEVRIFLQAIEGDQVSPLNLVWKYGLDDFSKIEIA